MMPANRERAGQNPGPNPGVWGLGMAALPFLAIATVYAFSTSYSYFASYDDEGTMMITVRGYLDGRVLYDEVLSCYGPLYYFYECFVHSIASLPLTNDAARAVCIFDWLAAASILAVLGGRMTRSVLMALFIFMQAVLHLTPLAREPGHPQELVLLLLTLSIMVAQMGLQRKWTPVLLGAIGAALVCTKINAGAFFGFGLMLALVTQAPLMHSRRVWFWILLALVGLLPVLLMRTHFAESSAQIYCGQVCIAVVAAGAIAYVLGGERQAGLVRFVQTAAGFAGLSALLVVVLLLRGTSLSALVANLITTSGSMGALFIFPLKAPYCSW
ncbi:MAG: hypothetical protein LUO89_16275, partial [Methanothrix sp.]|nr:hypothetical protein [Methanothrix sp.]